MPRICFILNPAAGRGRAGRQRRRLAAAAAAEGLDCTIRETTRPGEERRLAADAAAEGWPWLVAVGGDGTVHGVANGVLDAATDAAVGVLPLGTGNDFAKLTGMRRGPIEAMLSLLLPAAPRRFDVGRALGEHFTNGLGIGFGPTVIRELARWPRLRGFPLYLTAVFRTFGRFRPVPVVVAAAEHRESSRVMLVEVSVGTTAGGGFRVTPDADPADGLLDVCVIREVSTWQFLRYVPRVIRGTHGTLPPVTLFRTRRVTCTGADGPLELHMDGELRQADAAELEVTIDPQRLSVLCVP